MSESAHALVLVGLGDELADADALELLADGDGSADGLAAALFVVSAGGESPFGLKIIHKINKESTTAPATNARRFQYTCGSSGPTGLITVLIGQR